MRLHEISERDVIAIGVKELNRAYGRIDDTNFSRIGGIADVPGSSVQTQLANENGSDRRVVMPRVAMDGMKTIHPSFRR